MAENMSTLEDEIRASLLTEGEKEMISGDLKILMKENGRIEITELPVINLEQLELPLISHQRNPKKEDPNHETTKPN
jgi:hypothetical protein